MPKYKIEFLYDRHKDKTNIFIWLGQQLIDKRDMNGQLSSEHEKKIRTSIELELIEKD